MFDSLIYELSIGSGMILATFLFHAYSLDCLISMIYRLLGHTYSTHTPISHFKKTFTLFLMSVGVIFIHTIEIWGWAILYIYLDLPVFSDFESALYFSAVSFSTLGYGDIVLPAGSRLLGAMQGASGLILFGWSTAFMFEILVLTYNQAGIKIRATRD